VVPRVYSASRNKNRGAFVLLMYRLPAFFLLRLLSQLTGMVSRIYIPVSLRRVLFLSFSRIYGVSVMEAEKEVSEYATFADFFTRNLKKGTRPLGEGLLSPVDGKILEYGTIRGDVLIQAKGLEYTLGELFGYKERAEYYTGLFENGSFCSFYLAPGDYHHIHSPVSGEIVERIYIPGSLLPVGLSAVKAIPSLYCTNERVITVIKAEEGCFGVVKVGATNVGTIGLEYETGFHRAGRKQKMKDKVKKLSNPVPVLKGQRLGTFYLGSTVIILSQKKLDFSDDVNAYMKVLFGQSITK
jgi:phosphatidylserine decarboxylase